MLSLRGILTEGRIKELERILYDLDVIESDRIVIFSMIAKGVTDAVVRTGKPVIEDFDPKEFIS